LFKREGGFKIAVNILNIGRIKLAAAVLGGSKQIVNQAVNYSNERKQFGQSIHSFGAIQAKLANMIVRIYASEAASYRAGQNIDESISSLKAAGMNDAEAKLKGVEQFSIECAILKVHASEVLDFVADEGVQIFGGMGFSAEAPMERAYRDARINRIFEGTNEINRLLAIGTVLKRALKGEIDLMPAAMAVGKEILGVPDFSTEVPEGVFGKEYKVIANAKKAILMTAGAAIQKFTTEIEHQQEILMGISDMMIEVYVAESALARVDKLMLRDGAEAHQIAKECALVYLHEAIDKVANSGKEVIMGFAKGDELNVLLLGLKRFTKIEPKNLIESRRLIAQAAIRKNGYIF
jgi:alkylation response protein AidB-like acyl-CoA dehydrogenase